MKYYFIYKTIDPETGQFYIGKHGTTNLFDGYQGGGIWIKEAKKQNRHLITGILDFASSEDEVLLMEEKIVTKELLLNPLCMNRQTGGSGCVTVSEQTRKKMSKAKSKENNPNWGKVANYELRKKLSIAKSGNKHPFFNKKHSENSKQKIRESSAGQNNSQYGKPRSQETIKKMKTSWSKKDFIVCPNCGKQGKNPGNMKRYHFNNCQGFSKS